MVTAGDFGNSHGIAVSPLHLPHSLPCRDVVLQGHMVVGSGCRPQFVWRTLHDEKEDLHRIHDFVVRLRRACSRVRSFERVLDIVYERRRLFVGPAWCYDRDDIRWEPASEVKRHTVHVIGPEALGKRRHCPTLVWFVGARCQDDVLSASRRSSSILNCCRACASVSRHAV